MNRNRALVVLVVWLWMLGGVVSTPAVRATPGKGAPEIAPYLAFLDAQRTAAVDYLLGLFETHDMVILCERDHRDMTQYDFLARVVAHPAFVEKVGHIFTEVGSVDREKDIESVLTSRGLSLRQVEMRLLEIYRNLSWGMVWEKTNSFDFLRRLQRLNSGLPDGKAIHLHPCDLSFDWKNATPESWQAFRKGPLIERDRLMADHVIKGFRALARTDPRRQKALVIMNYRHAFNDRFGPEGQKMDNTGRYLFEAFPGRVCNVLVNTLAMKPDAADQNVSQCPIQDGKWDAAFRLAGNPEIGFPLAGSPFGRDGFDLFPFFPHTFSFQDVFDGMIFVSPLERLKISVGIPGIHSAAYARDLLHRLQVSGKEATPEKAERMSRNLGILRQDEVENLPAHLAVIGTWIR